MKRLVIVAGGLGCALVVLLAGCSKRPNKVPPPIATANDEVRAVSLSSLQQKLKTCMPRGSCPSEFLQLAGIKKIIGLIADEQNHDLVLLGRTDSSLPPLNLEDFVVALRNAWLKYAPLNGNTYEYSHPGCSIDPNPKVVQELQRIGQSFHKEPASGSVNKSIDDWNRVCEGSQSVRVLGIPFDTHFAQVMVKADYDMKRLVDGSEALDIPGLSSITDMELEKARSEIAQSQPIAIPAPSLNRFWFYPGENIYEERDGIILIKQCPVKLLTEQMYSNRGDQIVGSGGTDSTTSAFAEGLTVLYGKVAQVRPVYAELEALFRFAALAKIIKSKYSNTGVDLSYFLDNYPVATTAVAKSLPGRHAVKEFEHRENTANGFRQINLWLPSCGGVDIGINADAAEFRRSADDELPGYKQRILGSRLTRDTPYWVFSKEQADLTSELSYNSRVFELNQANPESRLFTIAFSAAGRSFVYRLYDGDRKEEFINIPDLVRGINSRLNGNESKTVYFDLEGFPTSDKVEAFATSCRIQQGKLESDVKIVTLPRRKGSTDTQDAFFSRGIRFDSGASRVEEVSDGKHKGRFRAVFKFFTFVGGALKGVVLNVYFNTRSQAETFFDSIRLQSSSSRFRLSNMSDVVSQILRDQQDFSVSIEDELGETFISELFTESGLEVG